MAGLSLSLLVVLGVVTWRLASPEPYVAPDRDPQSAGVEAGAASAALNALQQAVDDRDRESAVALAGAGEAARAQLSALVENASTLKVADFSLRYVDEIAAPDSDGQWSAAVDTTWRFAGFDRAPASAEVLVRFAATDGDVRIVGIGGEELRTPVWMSGPVSVRRDEQTLVLVAGDPGRVADYAGLAERAVPVVREVITRWRPRLVVEVPADLVGLARALDAEAGDYAQIAAVTTTADGTQGAGAPVHVYVNPDVYDDLRGVGAQVVMSHEATHVATDAPASVAPTWLVEGIADYVALRDVTLPESETAAQIAEQVRADGVPTALPGPGEFTTTGPQLGSVYEAAWLICEVLGERRGQDAVVGLYDDLSDGGSLEASLERLFAWSEDDLVEAWQQRLTDLAA